MIASLFLAAPAARAQSAISGKWLAEFPDVLTTLDLKADGTVMTGSIIKGTQVVAIYDGTVDGNTVSFKVKSPSGGRTVAFSGKISGDEISFTRDVQVAEGGSRGGNGIYGTEAPRTFIAKRAPTEAQLGAIRDSARTWLASHAIPLRTVEAGNGFDDMQPLKQIVGNARVVSLGEATHGTHEFFQLKHRMLEFLVSEMGFTVFGMEATMPEAYAINEYVLTGKGDPARALAALYFWTWNTEEVLDMIHWMRQYNADSKHVKKVKFYGFDMQAAPLAMKVTLAYLRKVDPARAADAETALGQLANPITGPEYIKLPAEKKAAARAAIDAVLTSFDARKRDYIGKTSEPEWAVARQHANIVAQNLEMREGTAPNSAVRDSSMAANVRWILDREGPRAKMVVWAHNIHVATHPPMMGSHLRKALGAEMVVFGLTFNEGSFQSTEAPPAARVLRPFTVGTSPVGSLDATLADAGVRIGAIDLRAVPRTGVVAKWFADPKVGIRVIGAIYFARVPYEYTLVDSVPNIFDALLTVEKTSAARPNKSSTIDTLQKLDHPTNLDFEAGEPGQAPDGWIVRPLPLGLGFEAATSGEQPFSGKRNAMLSRAAGYYYGEIPGSLAQRIDATTYRGQRIRLHVMARTDAMSGGNQAYVRLQVTKTASGQAFDDEVLFDNLIGQPVTSASWRSYDVEADVPASADVITYGTYLIGTGRVWMDAVSLEVVAKPGAGGRSRDHR